MADLPAHRILTRVFPKILRIAWSSAVLSLLVMSVWTTCPSGLTQNIITYALLIEGGLIGVVSLLIVHLVQRRSLSILQTTLESIADGIIVLDQNWTITHYNQKFLAMWQVPELLVAQQDDHQLVEFLKVQLLEAEAFVRQICAEYATPTLENRSIWTFLDGRVFERHSQPQWLDNAIIGRVVSYRDITEQKQAEAALRQSEARFHVFMNYSPLLAWISDITGRILYVNQPFLNSCQLAIENGIGKTVFELFPAEYAQQFLENTQTVARTQQMIEIIETAPRSDGSIGSYLVYKFPILDGMGQCFVGGVAVDITERKQIEDALFQEKELAQVTLQSIGEAVITTNATSHIEYLNPVAEALTGWSQQEAQGLPLTAVFNIVDEATWQPVENPVEKALQQDTIVELVNPTILLSRDGREIAIDDSAAPIHNRDGEIVGAVLVFQDVTQTRALSRQLAWHASHDALTGLVNRREFEQRLEQAFLSAKTQALNHALCYLDLDRFKIVNDTCGHAAGDRLLQQVTALLQAQICKTDTLARLGGDEFGVLLHNCSIEQALCAANAIRECVQQFRFVYQGQSFTIGVSIGLVEINCESESLSSLLCAADAACYAAKNRGRNRVHQFQPNDAELLQQRGDVQWLARLTQALEEDASQETSGDRFCLYCQPIAAVTQTGLPIDHYEVLLRLQDHHGNIVSPMVFIPTAERYNLMHRIDRWVIRTLFRQWAQIANPDRRIYAINLSGASMNDDDFMGFLHGQFAEWRVPPSLICFEITETVAIANLTKANQFVQELQRLGCHFALDDFGSGMSSFSYLKNLSVNYLKIYGGFVQNIATDLADAAMVEAITQIGHAMGMKTIAEFVENDTILERIKAIGVDYAQGYGVAKPCPLSHLLKETQTES